jgi:hypothetical protein
VALTALFSRLVESERAPLPPGRVLETERSLVTLRFGGSRPAYIAALRSANATVAVARGVIADGLRRAEIASELAVPTPTETQVQMFYDSYPATPVRRVTVTPAPSWLPASAGFVLFPPGPAQLLGMRTGVRSSLVTGEGSFEATAVEPSLPLGAVPFELARSAVRVALRSFARADAFEAWTVGAQQRALNRTSCLRDALPTVGSVDLWAYLPFLAPDA